MYKTIGIPNYIGMLNSQVLQHVTYENIRKVLLAVDG